VRRLLAKNLEHVPASPVMLSAVLLRGFGFVFTDSYHFSGIELPRSGADVNGTIEQQALAISDKLIPLVPVVGDRYP
jgi:hypothetical protein